MHDLCPFKQNQDERRSQTLVEVKIRILQGSQLRERVDASVTELRGPSGHLQQRNERSETMKEDQFDAFNARFQSFFCGVMTNQ